MEQWEIDLRTELNQKLEDGLFDLSSGSFKCFSGKTGYIEFVIALHKEIKKPIINLKTNKL